MPRVCAGLPMSCRSAAPKQPWAVLRALENVTYRAENFCLVIA